MNSTANFRNNIIPKNILDNTCIKNKSANLGFMKARRDTIKH